MKNWRAKCYQEHNNTIPVQSPSYVFSWPMNTLIYSAFHRIVGTLFCNYELFNLDTYGVFPPKCDAHDSERLRGADAPRIPERGAWGSHYRLPPKNGLCSVTNTSALTGHKALPKVYRWIGGWIWGTNWEGKEAAVAYVQRIISESASKETLPNTAKNNIRYDG
jgi:hypothetical protein